MISLPWTMCCPAAFITVRKRTDGPFSDASGSAVTDLHLAVFDDDRYTPRSAGVFEHLSERRGVFLHIYINGLVSVSLPGFAGIPSAVFSINDDPFFVHVTLQDFIF